MLPNIYFLREVSLYQHDDTEILVKEHTWLAHLVSRFACNTRVIVNASSSPRISRLNLL